MIITNNRPTVVVVCDGTAAYIYDQHLTTLLQPGRSVMLRC